MATAPKAQGLLRATTSFAAPGNFIVAEGDVFSASDPIVKGREALFVPFVPRSSVPAAGSSDR